MQPITIVSLIMTLIEMFSLDSCIETPYSAHTGEPIFVGLRPPEISESMRRPSAIIIMIALASTGAMLETVLEHAEAKGNGLWTR